MNKKEFSPYIRIAMFSTLKRPFVINERIIFDYEIILVSGGRCKITIDGIEYLCKSNDVVFIPPNVSHKFECVEDTDFVQPHIHFDISYTDLSEERFVSYKPKDSMSDYEQSLVGEDVFKNIGIPYVFAPYDLNKFKKIFFDIIEIFQKKDYNYELLYKSKMLELLDCILTQFEADKTGDRRDINDSVILVKNYIDNNYLSEITLDSLAEQFYLNKYTLVRKFKSIYNQGVISYYRGKRIEYAKSILKTTTIPIQTIAEKLNFSDIYSFSRFFKTYAGCSPTSYRKRKNYMLSRKNTI